MRPIVALMLVAACSPTTPPPTPTPQAPAPQAAAALQPLGEPGRAQHVAEPQGLGDYMPSTLDGAEPITPGPANNGVWSIAGRTVTIALGRIDDVEATRRSFELLGKDVHARMHGQELRGLRVQGNPAQLARDLDPPHRATLTVVAANTYLVTVTVEPSLDLDEPLHFAGQLDIGGMTRLALAKAR